MTNFKRPNLTKAGCLVYIMGGDASLTKSMNRYVLQKRISQKECDNYLAKHIPLMKEIQASFSNGWPAPEKTPVINFAIRGYYLKSFGKEDENDRNVWDDAFILIGPGYYKTFRGNTDPREQKVGKAMLLPGVHIFKQGKHGVSKAGGGYAAFRTADPSQILPVLRDGQIGIKKGITINLHKGGDLNTNSAGCQTVQAMQWPEFKEDAYKLTGKTKKLLTHFLVEQTSYKSKPKK